MNLCYQLGKFWLHSYIQLPHAQPYIKNSSPQFQESDYKKKDEVVVGKNNKDNNKDRNRNRNKDKIMIENLVKMDINCIHLIT